MPPYSSGRSLSRSPKKQLRRTSQRRIRAYKAELAVDGTRVETRLQLAKVYLQIEAYTDAVDEYHRIIASMEANAVPDSQNPEHNSDISTAYYGLGLAYTGLEKFEDAVAAYQRAIAVVPDWAHPLRGFSECLTRTCIVMH